MNRKRMIFLLGSGMVMLFLLFIDQLTKAFAAAPGINGYYGPYFLGLVRLNCFVPNAGIAFGIVADNPTVMAVITVLTVALIIGIAAIYFTVFKNNVPVQICLMVIEAGAVGNLIDRLCLGYVRDFIDVVQMLLIPSYTCNVADIYIVFGAIALVFIILFIGPGAVCPLTKKWREEAKRLEAEKAKARKKKS